jgi:hypothetical protein
MSITGRGLIIALLIILAFALWPVASISLAQWIANAHGCLLHEGAVNPCVVAGGDRGATLYTMFSMGWFMIATLPLGACALMIWAIFAIIYLSRRSNGRAVPS